MNNTFIKIALLFLTLLVNSSPALAVKDFNIKNNSQSFLYVNGTSGNVGIGSVTPGTDLDVTGTVRMTGFTLSNNGAAAGNIMVTNAIGIGTWMPAYTLNVSGTNYWSLTTATGNVGISTTNTVGIGTTAAGVGTGLNDMNGNVGIGTWAPNSKLSLSGNAVVASGAGYLTTANAPSANGVKIQGNVGIGTFYGGTFNLTVGDDNNGGTVGIGTSSVDNSFLVNTAPYSLEVQGPAYGLAGIFSNSSGRAAVTEYGAGPVNSVAGYVGYDGLNMALMATAWVNNLTFGTNSAERMRIDINGNVGIGTILPKSKLALLGNMGIAANANDAYLTTTAPAGGMIVEGNVGIGTWLPRGPLDVESTTTAKFTCA